MTDPQNPPPPQVGTRRARGVLVLTSVLTMLTMGAVIVLGLEARRQSRARAGRDHADRNAWSDPYRNVPWEDEACEPDRAHPPRLVFDLPPEGLDFGAVKQGANVEEVVGFRNEGTGVLCIRDVVSGCGCIATSLAGEKRNFEPGEQGEIQVVLKTENYEGVQRKTVALLTNSSEVPRQTFKVKAAITAGLVAWPLRLAFPPVMKGLPTEKSVRLRTAAGGEAWAVTGVRGTVAVDGQPIDYAYEVVPVAVPDKQVVDVVIRHPGMDREGPFQDNIVIGTTHPDRPEIQVRAHLRVVPPILAAPAAVAFGYVPAPGRKARVRLMPGGTTGAFQVTGVRFEPAAGRSAPPEGYGFVASWSQGPDGRWMVEVTYDGEARRPGRLLAKMVVETTHPDMPRVEIDVSATIRP